MDRKLKQFLAVAETGKLSMAAELLNISQPTVTVNIRRLEEEHGLPLFERSSRGMTLTEHGRVLYEHVRVMDRLNEHAKAELRSLRLGSRPTIKIASGYTWWELCVRDASRKIQQAEQDFAFHVDLCSSFDGLRNLLSGDCAMFIGTRVLHLNEPQNFHFERLAHVEDGFFARATHPLQGKDITLADLHAFPRLDVAPFVNRHFGIAESTAPRVDGNHPSNNLAVFSTNSMTSGISLLQDTDAYMIYPIVTETVFKGHGLAMLNVMDHPPQRIEIGIYTLSERQLSPLLEQFRRLVIDAFYVKFGTEDDQNIS